MTEKKIVMIGRKVDLDSCGAGFFLGVSRGDEIKAIFTATPEELANHKVVCIECGGTGRTQEGNWDHHSSIGPKDSATLQVARFYGVPPFLTETNLEYEDFLEHPLLWKIVQYINVLDTQGPQALREISGFTPKISLSNIFSGMLLSVRDPVEQFHQGIEILSKVWREGVDPFGEMPVKKVPEWQPYIAAKQENDWQIAEALKSAKWEITASGKKLGYLETKFIGAPGALYNSGAEIVVAFNPEFGQPPVRKFTVAGNGIRVDAVTPKLNALESGWGGPATGTIVGSPREGSILSLDQVVWLVKETL